VDKVEVHWQRGTRSPSWEALWARILASLSRSDLEGATAATDRLVAESEGADE